MLDRSYWNAGRPLHTASGEDWCWESRERALVCVELSIKTLQTRLQGYFDGSSLACHYRAVRYAVIREKDSGIVFAGWAASTGVLQSLLCLGMCPPLLL